MAIPEPRTLSEVEIRHKNGGVVKIRAGSFVDVSENANDPSFLREWLGKGPYRVFEIRELPDGSKALYLPRANGAGVSVSDFVCVD